MLSIDEILELSDDNTTVDELKKHIEQVRPEVLSSFKKLVSEDDFIMVDVDCMVDDVIQDTGIHDDLLEPEVYLLTKTYMLNIF